ncbi:MAG: ATP-binding cassette domain-containing protein [Acidisphaera sp.]|nr:ATP-binding cassette domain-containing protein [Acidisphaera sp.]
MTLRLQDIAVTFNAGTPLAVPALRGVDLTLPAEEFVTVIGGNGAGKSTLLRVIGGEVVPDHGRVVIDGADVTRLSVAERARLVGRVFQDPRTGTCERLTIEENLALAISRTRPRTLRPGVTGRLRARFREVLQQLGMGLENRMAARVGLLSGGQRQALSLLMATIVPTRVLLLDEHTAALDPLNARLIVGLSNACIRDAKLTALMVTHSMRQSLACGDRTIMMSEGRIAFDVGGPQRAGYGVPDLLRLFERTRGEMPDDDALLLS